MALPVVKSYRTYSTSNQGTNSLKLEAGNLTLYYNYGVLAGYTLRAEDTAVAGTGNWRSYNRKNEEAMIIDMRSMGFENVIPINYGLVEKAMRQEFGTPEASVTINSVNDHYKVEAIKVIRNFTGMDLKDAKFIVDCLVAGDKVEIGKQFTRDDAQSFCRELRSKAGCSCRTGDFLDDKVLTEVT